jgi:hypothetical protein
MISFALCGRLKNLMCFCQKGPFVLACFQASATPRPENSDSNEKDALFGLVKNNYFAECHMSL